MIIRQRTSEIFKIVDLIFDLVQICPSFPPRECQHSYLIIPIVALKSQANLAIICLVIHNPKQKKKKTDKQAQKEKKQKKRKAADTPSPK